MRNYRVLYPDIRRPFETIKADNVYCDQTSQGAVIFTDCNGIVAIITEPCTIILSPKVEGYK